MQYRVPLWMPYVQVDWPSVHRTRTPAGARGAGTARGRPAAASSQQCGELALWQPNDDHRAWNADQSGWHGVDAGEREL